MKTFIRMMVLLTAGMSGIHVYAVQGNLQSTAGFVGQSVGGANVAMFTNEADAVIENPAMMQFTKTAPGTHKFSLGVEYASYPNALSTNNQAYENGAQDAATIPFVGYFYNITDNVKFGTGLYAIGGTGYDYSKLPNGPKMLYRALSIPLAASYKVTEQFNLGLSLNIINTNIRYNNFGKKETDVSGYSLTPTFGATFEVDPSFVLGANFSLGSTIKYKDLSTFDGINFNDLKVGTPSIVALGFSHNISSLTYAFKYRLINWRNTSNYKELDWKDQHAFSFGGQYAFGPAFVLRAGLYYVTSVYNEMKDNNGDTKIDFQGQQLDVFFRDFQNAIAYGAPQMQYALGFGYKMFAKSNLDFGLILEPEATIEFTGKQTPSSLNVTLPYSIQKKNSNIQAFVSLSYEM